MVTVKHIPKVTKLLCHATIERVAIEVIKAFADARLDRVTYQTISGRVEGIFGWVAANYKWDENAGVPIANSYRFATKNTDGSGYLEMGGQPMQIAFRADAAVEHAGTKYTRMIRIPRSADPYHPLLEGSRGQCDMGETPE